MKEYNFCTKCNNDTFMRIRVIKTVKGFKVYGSCRKCLKSNELIFRFYDRVSNKKMIYLTIVN